MSDELKPCPFCGSNELRYELSDYHRDYICCDNCGASSNSGDSKSEVVAMWNTRPIEDAQAARIAELEAENAALREQARWIPVEERLPSTVSLDYPYSDTVWTVDEHGEINKAYYEPRRDEWYDPLHEPLEYEITYWRPIVGPEEGA